MTAKLKSFIVLYDGKFICVYNENKVDKALAEKDKVINLYKRGWEESDRINAHLYAELRHHKYKRCLAMARWCEERCARYDVLQERTGFSWRREIDFYFRWYQRWLELAVKFKEVK